MNKGNINSFDPILLVENDKSFIEKISGGLKVRIVNHIQTCLDAHQLKMYLKSNTFHFSFVLLNVSLPGIVDEGISTNIIENYPGIPVIIISDDDRVENAVQYMKRGVLYYYNYKKVDFEKLIDQIIQGIQLYENIKPIITMSKMMRLVFRDIARIAQTNIHVLIRGETGVGKELVAEAIHNVSGRNGKLVRANTSSIDDTLFADTLFGHKRGAFDGAKEDRKGLIEEAREGTLFLDEIGDLKADSQVRLLRLLQEGTYYRLGDDAEIKSNSRVITATNRDIESEIHAGRYREDFFQRLKSVIINIPPLRERIADIPVLVEHFINKVAGDYNVEKPIPTIEFIETLKKHEFKGNVRELEGLIKNLVIQYPGCAELTVDMLEGVLKNECVFDGSLKTGTPMIGYGVAGTIYPTFIEIEAGYYKELLLHTEGNQTKAADISGLERRTFNNRLISIKDKLVEAKIDYETLPPISEMIKRFH